MINYTIRRILASFPVILGILVVTFVLGRLVPGDPCSAMLGEKANPAMCQRFMHDKGFDQPILVQLGIYMRDVATGNFGDSIRFSRPIGDMLAERLPTTIELSIAAFLIAVVVGLPLGIVSAKYHNTPIDVSTMVGANIGVSMPVFWLGLMLSYLFGVLMKNTPLWLPPSGRISAGTISTPFYDVYNIKLGAKTFFGQAMHFLGNLYIFNSLITFNFDVLLDVVRHLALPALALSTIPLAIIARITRSSLLEILGLDYVRAARAKGLTEWVVIMKHAFRNGLLPLVTIMGLQLGGLLSGAILTETVFGLSGVGKTLFDGITARDYPVIQGFTVVIAVIYVSANLVVDLSYAFLDPRIRLD
jgi:ABC-type dipeptide/oligopeptide/nickel transport system permease component